MRNTQHTPNTYVNQTNAQVPNLRIRRTPLNQQGSGDGVAKVRSFDSPPLVRALPFGLERGAPWCPKGRVRFQPLSQGPEDDQGLALSLPTSVFLREGLTCPNGYPSGGSSTAPWKAIASLDGRCIWRSRTVG